MKRAAIRHITNEEFEKKFGARCQKAEFKNIFGEKFVVYSNGLTIYFTGDETDWKIYNLFNDDFNIWGREELYSLGVALQAINQPLDEKETV